MKITKNYLFHDFKKSWTKTLFKASTELINPFYVIKNIFFL